MGSSPIISTTRSVSLKVKRATYNRLMVGSSPPRSTKIIIFFKEVDMIFSFDGDFGISIYEVTFEIYIADKLINK